MPLEAGESWVVRLEGEDEVWVDIVEVLAPDDSTSVAIVDVWREAVSKETETPGSATGVAATGGFVAIGCWAVTGGQSLGSTCSTAHHAEVDANASSANSCAYREKPFRFGDNWPSNRTITMHAVFRQPRSVTKHAHLLCVT